jgi:hypothetical protein
MPVRSMRRGAYRYDRDEHRRGRERVYKAMIGSLGARTLGHVVRDRFIHFGKSALMQVNFIVRRGEG